MPKFESPIIKLGSGAAVPAAADYAEGQLLQPHPDDANGSTYTCVDVGGTNYWLGVPSVVGTVIDEDGSINSTRRYMIQYAPRSSRKALASSLDGHWRQHEANSAANYFTLALMQKNVTLASFSTLNEDTGRWKRIAQTLDVVVDFTVLDDEVDAVGTEGFLFYFAEFGAQILGWGVGLEMREIME